MKKYIKYAFSRTLPVLFGYIFLGIAFGIIVGGVFAGTPASKVMNAFPLSLFMILVGVTFLFGMAQTNGTMEKLTAYSIRACKGNTALVPIIIYPARSWCLQRCSILSVCSYRYYF